MIDYWQILPHLFLLKRQVFKIFVGFSGATNYFIANYSAAPNRPCNGTAAQKIGLQPGTPEVGCDAAHYWSFHNGGSVFLMGDGSTRMIFNSSNTIIGALSTRSTGELSNIP